jgi:serine/threonine protein kinase
MQRIYMEYCPHDDLRVLYHAHAKSDGFDQLLNEDDQPVPPVRIPVRALWSFFKDMAAAACIMKHGYNPLDKDADEPEEWVEIIHRDFKPSNFFLAAPLAKSGRGIPVCKVGDFGLTVPRDYEPLDNPEGMWYSGTPGWKAPEYNPYSQDFEPFYELSSATDVWAIGRTMLALMELPVKSPPTIRYDDDDKGHVIVGVKAELVATYGEELYSLIEKCLERTPGDRIKARDLLRAIGRQFSNPLVTLPLELREGDVLEHSQQMRWAT